MRKRIFLAAAVVLLLPALALAQAAAESALIHGLSSSSTVKAGSALNRSLNENSSRMIGRIQQGPSSPAHVAVQQQNTQRKHQLGSKVLNAPASGNASMTIQGGQAVCASKAAQASALKITTEGSAPDCDAKAPTSKSGIQDKYRSYVSLSFTK